MLVPPGGNCPWLSAAAVLLIGACSLIPPALPDYPVQKQTIWLDQGWTPDQRYRYHRTVWPLIVAHALIDLLSIGQLKFFYGAP